jgi:hypothetical protein
MSAFAFGRKLANDGYLGHGAVNAQRYSPQMAKREFSPSEREDIEEGQSRAMPTIFQNYGTPVSEMMASPLKQSLIAGVPAALLGAVAGHALGGKNPGLGAAIGGLGAGGVAGLARYFGQQNTNEGLEELMRRLPEGATKRDLLADPAYQADLDRRNELRAARMSYNGGGLRGKFASNQQKATDTKPAASALEFGQKVAFIDFNDSRVQSGLGGAALGAGIGGLAGLVSPGEDERGRKRNRFGAALAGALGGAGVGGLGAAGATHFMGANPQLQQFGANIGSRLAGLFGNKAEAAPAAAADAAAPASRGPVPNVIRPLANKSVDQMIEERDALRFPAANDPMSFPEEPGGAMFIDTPSRTNALGPRALQPLGVDAAMAKEKQDVAMQRARQEAAARVSRQVPQDFRNQQQQMLQMQQNMLRGR